MAEAVDVWARAAEALLSPYGSVKIRADEYTLNLALARVEENRAIYEITMYVNGWFRGEWILKDCEERRRFFRPVVRRLYRGKHLATWKRLKRLGGAWDVDLKKTHTSYMSSWPTFGPLKRHLLKHNKDVRVVAINGQDVEAGPLPQAGEGVDAVAP